MKLQQQNAFKRVVWLLSSIVFSAFGKAGYLMKRGKIFIFRPDDVATYVSAAVTWIAAFFINVIIMFFINLIIIRVLH